MHGDAAMCAAMVASVGVGALVGFVSGMTYTLRLYNKAKTTLDREAREEYERLGRMLYPNAWGPKCQACEDRVEH